uniref:GIR1-like zinc ribbon domain-containing protein n=1 Tax=Fagus sylvatica TaxID=28930 RepID=A0A2N9IE86_FAGSY
MSRRAKSPKLELKLNLSPPRALTKPEDTMHCPSSPESTSMVLVGCPRCLMYVMLSEVDPKCPKCKSTVLLDFLKEENSKKTRN